MLDARRKRRRQTLKEFGEVMAFAFHEPNKLPDALKPPIEELVQRASTDEESWDNDSWWQEVTD